MEETLASQAPRNKIGRVAQHEAVELIQFAAARLATCKTPEQIIFRDAPPKTATGKMDRRALREAVLSEGVGPEKRLHKA